MKKVITILIVISIVAVVLLIFFFVYYNGKPPAKLELVLIPFAIPLFFRSLSLAANRDKFQPKTWLIIYGILAFVYIIGLTTSVLFGFPFEVSLF